jgi:hypothetical protein
VSDFIPADVVENRTDFGIFERAPQPGINYAAYPATCSAMRAQRVDRIEALPKVVRDIAWRAQLRLCTRYRRLSARGKVVSKWLCRAKAASKQLYPKAIAAGRYLFIW